MSDFWHRHLVESVIKNRNDLNEKIIVEQPYNFYGSRGFIDIYVKSIGGYLRYYEIKPFIEDLGGAIRQLKGAKAAMSDERFKKNRYIILTSYLTEENINIIINNINILKCVDENFIINFYDIEEKSFSFNPFLVDDIKELFKKIKNSHFIICKNEDIKNKILEEKQNG